eukprot:scaffold26169_cov66-Phaeocystis_antarctica.AAC.2
MFPPQPLIYHLLTTCYLTLRLATLSKRAFAAFSSNFSSTSAFALAAFASAAAAAFFSIFDTLVTFAASTSRRRPAISVALHLAAAACLALTCFSAAILATPFAALSSAAWLGCRVGLVSQVGGLSPGEDSAAAECWGGALVVINSELVVSVSCG